MLQHLPPVIILSLRRHLRQLVVMLQHLLVVMLQHLLVVMLQHLLVTMFLLKETV